MLSLFLCFIFSHQVFLECQGHPSQARKDKQACEPNLACLLKARGARAVQQTSEKKQASFNSSSNELKLACLWEMSYTK